MTSTTPFELGTVAWVRPWRDGRRLPYRKAVIIDVDPHELGSEQNDDNMIALWFPSMGPPVIGPTVQGFFRREVKTVLGGLEDQSARTLGRWSRMTRLLTDDYRAGRPGAIATFNRALAAARRQVAA